MSTRRVLTLASMAAILFAPAALGVSLGEKQDSGLGDLPPSYTAAEFQRNYSVVGEKRDSGLGDLSSNYTAAEFQKQVIGEKLDSGLGDLPADYTAAEFQKQIVAKRS